MPAGGVCVNYVKISQRISVTVAASYLLGKQDLLDQLLDAFSQLAEGPWGEAVPSIYPDKEPGRIKQHQTKKM